MHFFIAQVSSKCNFKCFRLRFLIKAENECSNLSQKISNYRTGALKKWLSVHSWRLSKPVTWPSSTAQSCTKHKKWHKHPFLIGFSVSTHKHLLWFHFFPLLYFFFLLPRIKLESTGTSFELYVLVSEHRSLNHTAPYSLKLHQRTFFDMSGCMGCTPIPFKVGRELLFFFSLHSHLLQLLQVTASNKKKNNSNLPV